MFRPAVKVCRTGSPFRPLAIQLAPTPPLVGGMAVQKASGT